MMNAAHLDHPYQPDLLERFGSWRCRLLLLALLFLLPLNAHAETLDLGLRYDRANDGHGLSVHKQGQEYVVFFYTYKADGSPEWYLCQGPISNGVVRGDCSRYLRHFDQAPPVLPQLGTDGSFTLDFVGTDTAAVCNDGIDRSSAPQLAVFGWASGEEYFELCTEYLAFGDPTTESYHGGIWYDATDPGFGCTLSHRVNTLTAICYYHDSNGEPRWALGGADSSAASVELIHYGGYCRSCPVVPLSPLLAGTLSLDWDPSTLPSSGNDLALLSLQYPAPPGETFVRDFILTRLSDGAVTGAHAVPEAPIRNIADVDAFSGDLDILDSHLRSTHPNPFHGFPQAQYLGQVAGLRSRLPFLENDQIAVEITRIISEFSRAGRGHC
jgi:hypothetical protein